MRPKSVCLAAALLMATAGAPAQYISADTYTRYELLAPETHQFRIFYEVTETKPGARFHCTGKQLKFEIVTGSQAKADSPDGNFDPATKYIKVHLAHPVPARGEYRLRIDKTYKDEKSYYAEGDLIVFKRSLGIPRNSVVAPAGYEIVSTSVAAQVISQPDGRLKLAFVNPGSGGQLEVTIRARRLASAGKGVDKP
jgi:hypothetical protein